ncbi:uncharacterized protein LOC105633608 [Jatropha curcas]|uniref:uncharacterized protein LOC105633608 n=1 Tax=Jatropha curcas TaxID=180498 RepID=UPI0005FB6EE4|nr:uncharacterized protein LOC105633608 [Jatropha curcas]
MPTYAQFLKDILSSKRKLVKNEIVALTDDCSALILNKLLLMLKDPGSFSIPCEIGEMEIQKPLCDLGASVSLMPLLIFSKLNTGELKPKTMILQLADRLVNYALGVVEDVLVKVGKLFIPVDFVVLDMDEDRHIPIILGRPFLEKAGALIDLKNGKLTLQVDDGKLMDVVEELVEAIARKEKSDNPLHTCLVGSKDDLKQWDEASKMESYLEAGKKISPGLKLKVEKLKDKEEKRPKPSLSTLKEEDAPNVELKQLPPNLRYAFLGPNSTYPVIINASLSELE